MTRFEPDEDASRAGAGERPLRLSRLSSGSSATFDVSFKTYVSSEARSASKLRPMCDGVGLLGEVRRELDALALEGLDKGSALADAKEAVVLAVVGLEIR